jgi:GAF domain-containing protein
MATLDDPKRLDTFHGAIMDDAPDEILNECVAEAARLADAPLALITFVMGRIQFFRASVGLPPELALSKATSRCDSFCQFVVRDEKPFIVVDAPSDPRVPKALVDSYGIGAYLGVPVVVDGQVLGSFCVIDVKPRAFSDALARDLTALSSRVTRRLAELAENDPRRARAAQPITHADIAGVAAQLAQEARAFERALIEVGPLVRLANGVMEGELPLEAFARGARALHEASELFEDMLDAAHDIAGKSERLCRFYAVAHEPKHGASAS